MEGMQNNFDITAEQQDTASLLDRLLGKAIADRYVDFCRLAAGAFALNVSRPVTAHALRELDSTLRHVLAVPMEAKTPDQPENSTQIEEARKQLGVLGFGEPEIQRAIAGLSPRLTHKSQIRKIVTRLGLDPEGDIARQWISLCNNFGKAHERSFHHALKVDEDFRLKYQQPFDTVIRAIAVALEGRYVALMRRVEELAAMPNRALAVAAFASEIPGALPLQWHFFHRLTTGDWLPHLMQKELLGEPLYGVEESNIHGAHYRQWPAGNYLHRMASSTDATTRSAVVEALREVANSPHPDIRHYGMEILAALPSEEAASLTDIAVAWVDREVAFGTALAADRLLKKFAASEKHEAALRVARPLLQLWDDNGETANLFGRHMYEHHLPPIMEALTKACGEDGLCLLMDLLVQAAEISRRINYEHHTLRSVSDDEMANSDPYSALISAVRRSAEMLVADDPSRMRGVITILTRNPAKIFTRLALHVLAQNPLAAPDLAETNLMNVELIEGTWGQEEYATLARAWFPSLSRDKQEALLRVVDALPDKYLDAWRERFTEHHKSAPTPDNERIYTAITVRDAVWKWRSVLPIERQQALNQTVAEHGDPEAWRHQMFPLEESPLTTADFSNRPVSETAAFLRTWSPQEQSQRQTVTALAQELRNAVGNDPNLYAASADQFIDLKPIYIRRVLEGLQNAVTNQRDFDWSKILKLIVFVYNQHDQVIDPTSLAEGDDKNWLWACTTASELLVAGLRRGERGIAFEHATLLQSLVFKALALAPSHPELEDFEERFRRESFFAAQATLRGSAVEMCILAVFWLSKDTSSSIGSAPRRALENLPDIRQALESQLADRSADGRVPRAIIGRYLRFLFHFGEEWLRSQIPAIFSADNDGLRRTSWHAHLGHDQGPLSDLMAELHGCYAEEIALLASKGTDREFRDFYHKRLADYVLVLHLWGGLPNDLMEQFWRDAPAELRRHAMWFVGNQVSRPSSEVPDEVKARGFAYWERRLNEATLSSESEVYRAEMGTIGQWCFHGTVDETWLCEQLSSMLEANFVPSNAYTVVEWLGKIAPRHVDRAVELMVALLRHPLTDQWAYMTHRDSIRAVLSEGLSRGTPETVQRVHEIISYLSTIAETTYLDLLQPSTAA